MSACARKALTSASICARNAWVSVGYYGSDENKKASSHVAGPEGVHDRTRLNGVVLSDRCACVV